MAAAETRLLDGVQNAILYLEGGKRQRDNELLRKIVLNQLRSALAGCAHGKEAIEFLPNDELPAQRNAALATRRAS